MKWTSQICAILTGAALGLVTLAIAPSQATAEPPQSGGAQLASCDRYMIAYARSASRKLGRSLSGQKYELTELPSRTGFEASLAGDQTRQFEVVYEHDNAIAGLVEKTREHRTSYTITRTSTGPVITRHDWPEREAIASGKKECKPTSSAIMAPEVPVAAIDVEPFKFWGLRVVWHLPTEFADSDRAADPFEALRNLLAGEKGGENAAKSDAETSE